MKPYPECNRDMPELRQKIGQLFEQMPELETIELTHGGQRYRARRSEPWVMMDAKADGRGWNFWTEYFRRKAMGANWREKVAEEKRRAS